MFFWTSPLRRVLLDPDAAIRHFQMMGIMAGFLFAFAHVVATILWFPGSVLVVAGGAIFGVFWGTVWSVCGATIGAVIAFWLARYLMRDWVERRFRHHPLLKRVNHTIRRRSLRCVFAIRFAPISPFTVINFVFGVTPIALKPYLIGTFLGIIPGTLIYTWVGATGHRAIHGENIAEFVWALGLLTLLSIVPLLMRSRPLPSEE
ncbi:MAG: TVP38/TMEM64 family protein [Cyanobacteria bacterium J06627_8]